MANYNQILPIRKDCRIDEQFGWLPLSVLEPSRDHREQWPEAYLDDGIRETKRSKDAENLPGLRFSEFHAGLAEQILRYWSMRGSVIVDPFSGRATRAMVASKLGRNYQGYEVSKQTYDRCMKHFKKFKVSPKLFNCDGAEMLYTRNETADLVFTCPPYHNLEKYETAKNQLSECETYEEFMTQIQKCGKNINRVLKPGAFCVWVVSDWRDMTGSGLRSFHSDLITAFVNEGMIHHDTIIMKNLSPFAYVQCAKVASKRYTSKIHEYIMVFRKKGEYEIPEYCEQDELRVNSNKFFSYE